MKINSFEKQRFIVFFSIFQRTVSSKPQAKFRNLIDNSRERIFLPKLHEKPNSKIPLSKIETNDFTESIHPYADEINAFEPDENYLRPTESQVKQSTITFVDFLFLLFDSSYPKFLNKRIICLLIRWRN